jgi:hypothetical protein
MAQLPETARHCMDLAIAGAPAMVGRAVDQAVAALQLAEDRSPVVAERQVLADAWLELLRRKADWSQRFPELLRTAHARPARSAAPAVAGPDSAGGLALLDDDTLAREIESARVLQLLAPTLEQPLAELDALMSSALGLEVVQPERNPLRPEVFAQALREVMQPIPQPSAGKLWSQYLAPPLAAEIAVLYGEVLKLLRAARLIAASYRVLPVAPAAGKPAAAAELPAASGGSSGYGGAAPRTHAADPAAGSGTHGGSHGAPGPQDTPARSALSTTGPLGGAAWADLSRVQLADELFQHFLFSRTPPSSQPLAPAYYDKVDAQHAAEGPESYQPYDADAVQQHRTLAPVERPHRPVGTTRGLDADAWGRWAEARERSRHRARMKKEARQVGQVLGLEVVRKLVDQVACDPRLLAPVREAVVALEPALAKLALVTPRFFAQEDHAGRRLVERVAERSFRYNDEFTSDFHDFFAGVRSVFQALNDGEVRDEQPFDQALQGLEERWAADDAIDQQGRQVAVDAMHFAEAREAEAAQIAWSLSQRSDLEAVPAVVQDFLFGPWSLVMAHARLTDPQRQVDPGGWNAVVPELLWSVKPDQTLRDPARLFTTVPGMLERLRGGLQLVGQEPAQHETFFHALERLHRPVLKLRARSRKASHALEAQPQLDPALLSTERQQPPAPGGTPWLTPGELQAAGFEDEPASAPAPLEASAGGTGPDVAAVVEGLRQGAWVDLCSRGRWRRASLTWVSNRATLFMFVSHGGRPHSMTRRSLERLVRSRLLRPVDAGAVVPRAIEALSQREPAVAPYAPARVPEEQVAA